MLLTFMALGTTVDKIFNTKETFPSTNNPASHVYKEDKWV